MASLIALRRSKPVPATLPLVLAQLTRETALLIAVAAGVVIRRAAIRQAECFPDQGPLVLFRRSRLCIRRLAGLSRSSLGSFPVSYSSSSNRDLPFKGIFDGYRLAIGDAIGLPTLCLLEVAFLLTVWFFALATLRRSKANPLEKMALVVFALCGLALDEGVWRSDWAFLRVELGDRFGLHRFAGFEVVA